MFRLQKPGKSVLAEVGVGWEAEVVGCRTVMVIQREPPTEDLFCTSANVVANYSSPMIQWVQELGQLNW